MITKANYSAFLSCSIRPQDRKAVAFIWNNFFGQRGFTYFTVGLNLAAPNPPLNIMRDWIEKCDCLVTIVTGRFEARDLHYPGNQSIILSPLAVDQEMLIAWLKDKPTIVFKDSNVHASHGFLAYQKVTWVEFETNDLKKLLIPSKRCLIESFISETVKTIEAKRTDRRKEGYLKLLKYGLGVFGAVKIAEKVFNDSDDYPECYGSYDFNDSECKNCDLADDCECEND